MPRCTSGTAAGRALLLALPAACVAVVTSAAPAAAHDHGQPVGGSPWPALALAVVGGWFLADPRRRRQPVAVVAGLLLLVAPSWPDLLHAGHIAGAGLWAGAALSVLRRPSRAALRAASGPAVGGAVLACVTGLFAAVRLHVDLASPYGHLLLLKGAAVTLTVCVAALVVHRPRLVRIEALGLATALVLGALLASRPLVSLPSGVVLARDATVLVARDGDGRRLLRVTPATARVAGLRLSPALDGSGTAVLGKQRRLRIDGQDLRLPTAVPLAAGPGDDAERLARTLAAGLSGRAAASLDAAVDVDRGVAAARGRGLHSVVVLTDGDPRGARLADRLRVPAVDVRKPVVRRFDFALVATSWGGAAAAVSLARAADPVGGAVVLPWLVGATTTDAARAGGLQLLSPIRLDGPVQLAYRNRLRELPGERPSLVGLAAWPSTGPAAVYAASTGSILPAMFSHDHSDHDHELPAWAASGAVTAVLPLSSGGSP